MDYIIREAQKNEAEIIASFQIKMAFETENMQLDENKIKQGVIAVFNDKSKGYYYVAEYHGKIIASLLTTYEWSDWRNAQVLWIQSVYVTKEFRKKGVYKKMYQHIKNKVWIDENYCGIRLYVDKTNTNAQKVYTRLGMSGDHYLTFEDMK